MKTPFSNISKGRGPELRFQHLRPRSLHHQCLLRSVVLTVIQYIHSPKQVIIPLLWISAAILVSPLFLTIAFDQKTNLCVEYWPRQWLPKAYSITCFFFLGFIPVTVMTVLYSRVVYSLWFKREENELQNTRQVRINPRSP